MIDIRWHCCQFTGADYARAYDSEGWTIGAIDQVSGGLWRVTVRGRQGTDYLNDYACPKVATTALREALKEATDDTR